MNYVKGARPDSKLVNNPKFGSNTNDIIPPLWRDAIKSSRSDKTATRVQLLLAPPSTQDWLLLSGYYLSGGCFSKLMVGGRQMVLILPPNRPLDFCVFIWGQESAPDSVGLRSVPAAHHLYLWRSKSVVGMLMHLMLDSSTKQLRARARTRWTPACSQDLVWFWLCTNGWFTRWALSRS